MHVPLRPRTAHEDVTSLVRADVRKASRHPLHDRIRRLSDLNVTHDLDAWASYPEVWSSLPAQLYHRYLQETHSLAGLKSENFLVTRGSVEGMEFLIRALCTPYKDSIAVTPPTFPEYGRLAKINGIQVKTFPLRGANIDSLDITGIIESDCKIVFLSNPGNPAGTTLKSSEIYAIINEFRGIIVVDEVYAELAGPRFESAIYAMKATAQVVVLRSFSKAWSLAGLRLGLVIANEALIAEIDKLRHPFSISAPIVKLLREKMEEGSLTPNCEEIVRRRNHLVTGLETISCVVKIFPSSTSFVTIIVRDFACVWQRLIANACLATDCSRDIDGAIKLTIGSWTDLACTLTALNDPKGKH